MFSVGVFLYDFINCVVSQQPTSLDKLKMEQMEKYVNSDNGPSVKATAQPVEGEHYTSYATYYPPRVRSCITTVRYYSSRGGPEAKMQVQFKLTLA